MTTVSGQCLLQRQFSSLALQYFHSLQIYSIDFVAGIRVLEVLEAKLLANRLLENYGPKKRDLSYKIFEKRTKSIFSLLGIKFVGR